MTQSAVDVQDESVAPSDIEEPGRPRLVDRMGPGLVRVLTVLGFGLPVIGYFWFLAHFSVNAMIEDQWDDVTVIQHSYVHFFPWGVMWAQHFENRILFPNMVMVLLAHTVHFNIRVEEVVGAVLLVVAAALLLWAHKRRAPSIPWLYYCPVAFLVFSVVQYGNTIWGFQLAWYMVMLCLAAAIVLLDRVTLTWVTFSAAVAVAVVGSFSSLQGLLIWPTGLVLLYFRRRSWSQIGVWVAAAVVATVLYFHNYKSSVSPDQGYARHHLLPAFKFFLFAIGDVVGKPVGLGTSDSDNTFIVLFGLVIFLLAVATVLICGFRRDQRGASPVGIALICYGLLFAALITQGRSFLGYSAASFSRYTTFDVLILVGIYLALLGRRSPALETGADRSAATPGAGGRHTRTGGGWVDRVALPGAMVVVLMAIVVQIPFGIHYGIQGASAQYSYNVKSATVLRNISHESNSQVRYYLYWFEPPSVVREQARTLEEHHLSVFANR